MRLAAAEIWNFRSYDHATIEFDSITSFVGPNGAGKSSVLAALNVFFRDSESPTEVSALTEEDFHLRDTSKPIEIRLTFDQLSAPAQQALSAYARQGQLVVSAIAEWDAEARAAPVRQQGWRMVMPDFAPYFAAKNEGAKVADLKAIYTELRSKHPDLPAASTGSAMHDALRAYEEQHPELCSLLPSADEFYGWSKGANRLAPYATWVYVPAVKDAAAEKQEGRNTALGRLLDRTLRTRTSFEEPLRELRERLDADYRALIESQNHVLEDVSSRLQARLRQWTHSGTNLSLAWSYDPRKTLTIGDPVAQAAVGEGQFIGDIARLGHGVQRAFIITLLQELAEQDAEDAPTLILGIEEPELYQHPPQARHFAQELARLSRRNAQVILTTHSPYFVVGDGFSSVRMVRQPAELNRSVVARCPPEALRTRLAQALEEDPPGVPAMMAAVHQILQPSQTEMFFATVPVLVEGTEDVAYLSTYLTATDRWSDFRRLGCHFIVGDGKTNLSRLLAIALELGMHPFLVFDGDNNQTNPQQRARNARDNRCLLRLVGAASANPDSESTVAASNAIMWGSNIGTNLVSDVGNDAWAQAIDSVRRELGLDSSVNKKNTLVVTAAVLHLLEAKVPIPALDMVCSAILDHAAACNRM